MLRHLIAYRSPAPHIASHMDVILGLLCSQFAGKCLERLVIVCRCKNKVFSRPWLKFECLSVFFSDLLLRKLFAAGLQLALNADQEISISVPISIEINTLLLLATTPYLLYTRVLQDVFPKDNAVIFKHLFEGRLRDLCTGRGGHWPKRGSIAARPTSMVELQSLTQSFATPREPVRGHTNNSVRLRSFASRKSQWTK